MYFSEYMRSLTCTIVPCQRLNIAVPGRAHSRQKMVIEAKSEQDPQNLLSLQPIYHLESGHNNPLISLCIS